MTAPPPLPRTAPPRPTSVTVVAVLGILFGAWGVVCTPVGALPYFMDLPGGANPIIDMVKESTGLFSYMMAQLFVWFVMAVVLLAGSIGALMLKPWARLTLMGYAVVSLVLGVINAAVTVFLFLPMFRAADDPAMAGGAVGGMVGAGCGVCFGFIVQGALLYVLTRPDVKAAFEGR